MSTITQDHTVDITIDRNICGWFAICSLCRGTNLGYKHFPADIEQVIHDHSKRYHNKQATFGYYEDGARRKTDT